MNKDHWNAIVLDRHAIDEKLADGIDEPYVLVVERLARKARAALRLTA